MSSLQLLQSQSAPPLWLHLRRSRASADDILRLCDQLEPPVDVELIASRLGVFVWYQDQRSWAGAVRSEGNRADVWLKRDDAPVRRRFTLAHELGHLLLHPQQTLFRDTEFSGDRLEVQANRFAADLLMPLWMVYPAAWEHGGNVASLAPLFQVSRAAMRIRLENMAIPAR